MIIEILIGIVFACSILISIFLIWLAYKIYKVPNHIWEENRKNPTPENFERIMRYIKCSG